MVSELKQRLLENKNFLKEVKNTVLKRIKPLKAYRKIELLNYKDLVKFLSDFENAYPWFEAMWFLCEIVNQLKDYDLKPLLKIRNQTNNLASNSELVIRKSIEGCFPEYKEYADVIFVNEIKSKSIPSIKELKKRKQGFFFTNNELFVGVNKHFIEKKFSLIFEKENLISAKELRGSSAYKGKIKGTVKIIMGFQEIDKIVKGDILVASQTMPDIMLAMKKASAFVTDEGGMLSHAAIISREMKKPCIIGTKIATQVLKDGDLVEVDANKGIVKILKKSNK